MTHCRSHTNRAVCALLMLLLAGALAPRAAAQTPGNDAPSPDSVHAGMMVLYTGNLNFDCEPDTVWGTRDRAFHLLPRVIVWGRSAAREGAADTADPCLDPIPDSLKRSFTRITYPDWDGLTGSAAFTRFNGDTLADIFLTLMGRTGTGDQAHDTTRMVLLFGQHGLDTLPTLDIASVGVFQYTPFVAMQMRPEIEVVDPAARDLSGRTSWELMPVDLVIQVPDSSRTVKRGGGSVPMVHVVPNPASTVADLAATRLETGPTRLQRLIDTLTRRYAPGDRSLSGSGGWSERRRCCPLRCRYLRR
ncbi:MAG TPA: hypothetical protein VHI13_11130 [Candidatus Kapabacteria bacterium]|nr:hypothetical protein [Candidatus Kapabacteria bacterium]